MPIQVVIPVDDIGCHSALAPGLPGYRTVAGRNWHSFARTFIPFARRRLASGSPPRLESAAFFGHSSAGRGVSTLTSGDGIMAELDPPLFSRRLAVVL